MHVPKTAGTALASELEAMLAPTRPVRGLDRSLFGSFENFAAFSDDVRRTVFLSADELPRNARFVVGHFSHATLRTAYPDGQFLTLLREPVTRLLSHWLYWRQVPDAELVGWADWTEFVRKARRPLAEFLSDRTVAAQTDNLMTRALLWPHALIPADGFIDPRHDRRLLREARARLRTFRFVDIVERHDLEHRLAAWLGRPLTLPRVNETSFMPRHLRSPLGRELTRHAHARLEACSRLDLRLWRTWAARRVRAPDVARLRHRTIMSAVARYGDLMAA